MAENNTGERRPAILLVDDEEQFRGALKKQLTVRGYEVMDVERGFDAIKIVRHNNPEVVVLDQKMPGMDGIQTLKEIKKIRPEVQVIMLTGHANTDDARRTGKLDVFRYMQKPCMLDELIGNIEAARRERIYAMARNEIPQARKKNIKQWMWGAHNARPGFLLIGFLMFAMVLLWPSSKNMEALLTTPKGSSETISIFGYANYSSMKEGQTIAEYYSSKSDLYNRSKNEAGENVKTPLTNRQVLFRGRVMIGILILAAIFWATGAMPVGMTSLLVGVLMYFFNVLPPDLVAKAYAKDAVIFIFGILAISNVVAKSGLDKRIGIFLLATSKSLGRFVFIFSPLLAVTASFLSEHALIAFIVPVLMLAYGGVVRAAGLKQDRDLAVMMILMVCFVANVGGPGSPAAGGRNAVMIGILADYGMAPSFGEWVKYGFPFVPVMALVIAAYFYVVFRKKIKVKNLNLYEIIRRESKMLGKMTRDEYMVLGVLALMVILWATTSDRFGMGGPVILALVLMNILGLVRWRDINTIHWDVVIMYASACAMGTGLAVTGAALWMADGFISILPEALRSGTGLCISSSFFAGVLTNFMSDGATVAAIGPITVPMGMLSNTHPWMVGLATAFASSFAHMLIIGTPNNAIAFSLAKDPETGEQLVSMKDFLKHGFFVLILSFMVLWTWVFCGYWRWIGF